MSRVLPSLALASLICLPLAGCTGNRDLQQLLLDIRNENRMQLSLLDKQAEFLNQKTNLIERKIGGIAEDTEWLNEEFLIYTARPEEIREEVLTRVDEQLGQLRQDQADFQADLSAEFSRYEMDYETKLTSALDAMQATLDYKASFLRFVFTEQDSLNREFASRFDAKPWYHSVLSTWEESEKQE